MNYCARCDISIPSGEETWAKRKDGTQVALCRDCAVAIRQTAKPSSLAEPEPAPAPVELKIPMYRPSNKVPIDGFLMLLLAVMVGGAVVGGLVFLLSRVVYLPFLFPLGMAFAGAIAVAVAVRAGRVRNPAVAALFGVVAGLFIYGVYRYGDYLAFRGVLRQVIVQEAANEVDLTGDLVTLNQLVDLFLFEEVGQSGFIGYFLLSAREGVSFSRLSGNSSLNIGPLFTWLYWLLEVVVIAGLAGAIGAQAAGSPYCERHDRWYDREKRAGGVSQEQAKEALLLLQDKGYGQLGQMLRLPAPAPGLAFFVASCDDCQESNPVLLAKHLVQSANGRVQAKTLLKQSISPAQHADLLRGAAQARGSEPKQHLAAEADPA
ncbi:MAG: hypothetical protein L0332_02695 [Chloroflexi bacterium]|nr:hypothetical protein [Chloroflexota bacterium]MCI0576018.1 hypothetical protein [Chloroflexota bacterium]MCI0645142.1 hypothetical protein [Chloroflexota bacterium]MCI0725622.1 hypothetical protein [Chloroflexota bacterium]